MYGRRRRTTRYRRRRRRGTRTRRYRRGAGSLSKKVSYLLRQNKANRPQLDFDDTNGNAVNIFTTPTIVKILSLGLVGAARGTIKSIQLKGYLQLVGAVATTTHARIIIFTDKVNEGGAAPLWGDLYESAAGADAVMSLRELVENINEGQRFKVLYDKRFTMINAPNSVVKDNVMFDMYKKLNIKSINNQGTWWEKGGLYMAYVSTNGTADMDFTYKIRTRSVTNT